MGVLERGAGLPAAVHDGLAVAQVGLLGVLLDPVPDGRHDQAGLLVGELGPGGLVLGREDQDLVDPPGGGLGEDRAPVLHHEGLVALEGRVEVRAPPGPASSRSARRSRGRAGWPPRGPGRRGRAGRRARCRAARTGEGVGAVGPAGADGHPAAGERVEAELVHRGGAVAHRSFAMADGRCPSWLYGIAFERARIGDGERQWAVPAARPSWLAASTSTRASICSSSRTWPAPSSASGPSSRAGPGRPPGPGRPLGGSRHPRPLLRPRGELGRAGPLRRPGLRVLAARRLERAPQGWAIPGPWPASRSGAWPPWPPRRVLWPAERRIQAALAAPPPGPAPWSPATACWSAGSGARWAGLRGGDRADGRPAPLTQPGSRDPSVAAATAASIRRRASSTRPSRDQLGQAAVEQGRPVHGARRPPGRPQLGPAALEQSGQGAQVGPEHRADPPRGATPPSAGLAPPVDTETVTGPWRWTEGRKKVQCSASSALLTQMPADSASAAARRSTSGTPVAVITSR